MRLPHITIEYREEETYALESISLPLLLGFGVHWALVLILALNDVIHVFPVQGTPALVFLLLFFAITTIVLFCYAFFLKTARSLFSTPQKRRQNRFLGACFLEAALLLMLIPGSEAVQIGCMVLAGFLGGVGSAILTMSFGVSSSVCDLPAVVISIATAMPLGALIVGLVVALHCFIPIAALLACLAFPFLELIGLNISSTKLIDNLEFIGLTIAVNTRELAFRLIVPSLLFGLMIGLTRLRLAMSFMGVPATVDTVAPLILSGLFMGICLLAAMFTQRKAHNFAFRTLMPLVAVLLAVSATWCANQPALQVFCEFACYLIFMGCMWILCSDISQRFRISAFSAFGFGYGALLLGAFIAVALGSPVSPFSHLTTDNAWFFAIALVCITLGLSTLPRNSELLRTLKRGRTCPAFSEDVLLEETPLVNPGIPTAISHEATMTILAQLQENAEDSASVTLESTNNQTPSEPAPDPESTPKESPDIEPDHLPDFPPDEASKPVNAGRFKRKCAMVANTFLLSRKETEVLYLLARGRNSATIQESLYISAGTANTHMRHIYRKLDVHSQGELIDLVESMDPGPDVE